MIWVLIGLIWAGSILLIILDRYSLLMIIELFFAIGMAWIGSMGFSSYLIYFHPLTKLSYLYGYNKHVLG